MYEQGNHFEWHFIKQGKKECDEGHCIWLEFVMVTSSHIGISWYPLTPITEKFITTI